MTGTDKGSLLARSLASSWLALGIGVVVSFLLSPFVVNQLGAAWYGVWAIAGQLTGSLYLLDLGVRESIIRYTSKYAARGQTAALNRVLSVAITIYAAITFVTLIAVAVCVWGVPHWMSLEPEFWRDARWAVALAGLTIAQTFLFNIFNGIVLGLRRWDIISTLGIAWNLLRAALTVILLLQGYGIVALAAVQFAITLLAGLVTIFLARELLRRRDMVFRPTCLSYRRFAALSKRVLGYGLYVIINNVGEKLIYTTDAMVVGIWLPIQAVAYYAIAGSLIGYLRSLLSSTAQVFNPLASHLLSMRQSAELKAAFLLGTKLCILITLPVAAVFFLLGDVFIGLWMGAEFAEPSGQVLAILAISSVLSAPQYVFSSVLYGMSRHRVIAILRIVEATANLALSIVLVQTIGLAGVALGTAIPSLLIVMFVLPPVACRIVGIGLPEYYAKVYLRPALAITPLVLAAVWLRGALPADNLLVFFGQAAALTAIYVPCAFAIVLSSEERRYVLQRVKLTRATA
jgi:O-antigen/teichoic acid export membrane protein